jgi:hypothetical protein
MTNADPNDSFWCYLVGSLRHRSMVLQSIHRLLVAYNLARSATLQIFLLAKNPKKDH